MPTNVSAEIAGGNNAALTPMGFAGLGNRFIELFGRGLSKQQFAAEMTRLVAEAVRVRAVALLGCEPRRHRLTLLAQQGLTSEARAALGEGGECPWDIPLRGLRNRRISVIAAAHQNPFVPQALAKLFSTGGLAIASLPIYRDYEPAGVLLLFASSSRAFTDTLLHTLSQALRVCASGIGELDTRSTPALGPRGEEDSVDAAIAKLIDEHGATDSLPTRATPRRDDRSGAPPLYLVEPQAARPDASPLVDDMIAHVQRMEQRLEEAQQEGERSAQTVRSLTAARHGLLRERDGLLQRIAELEHARETEGAELRAQVSALEERLLAVDAERARHQRLGQTRQEAAQQSLVALENERNTLLERVRAAEASAAESHTALVAERAERARLATLIETLTAEVRTAQEALQQERARSSEDRTAAEADRDGWKEQAATASAQLAQRTETLVALDRDLRSTIVARDAAAAQLQAAREEIGRLVALTEELEQRATQADAARASSVAEAAALRRGLEEERTLRLDAEQALRADLQAMQAETQQRAAEVAALRAELTERKREVAERDEQLAVLRQKQEAAVQARTDWQNAQAALQADVTTLTARIEQDAAERQQLLDERAALNASLTQARQRASQADVEYAVALGQAQAEAAELRRRVETLTSDRGGLAARLDRAVEEGKSLTLRLADVQRRTHELGELLRERQALLEATGAEREQLTAQVAMLTGQSQATREALERAEARYAQERTALESDRDGWKEQATAAREELAQRAEELALLQGELRSAHVARDAVTVDLQVAREELERQIGVAEDLRRTTGELEAVRADLAAEGTALRERLDTDRAEHARAERALRAELATLRAEGERLSAETATLRQELADRTDAMAERDVHLAALRAEITALREQSADRGVLAQQAAELGSRVEELEQLAATLRGEAARQQSAEQGVEAQQAHELARKVVELEQALAVARGEGARTERQRAVVVQELEAVRQQQAQAVAAAEQAQRAVQAAEQRWSEERARREAEQAAQEREVAGQRAALAEVQAALEQQGQDVAQRLAEAHRRCEELSAQLRQREAAADTTASERQRLTAQVAKLVGQVRAGQEALDSTQGRAALERAALEKERESWKEQTAAARAESARLAASVEELQRRATEIEAAGAAAAVETAGLRQALEHERGSKRRVEEALRADLAAAQVEIERLAADSAALRNALAERDAEVTRWRGEQEAARQAQAESERRSVALGAEVGALRAQLEATGREYEQAREQRAAVEQQLALVMAEQGEAEQALSQALQAAREQMAQLEQERATQRAAEQTARQRLREVEEAQRAAREQAAAEAAQWREQVHTLTAARDTLRERMTQAEQALAAQSAQSEGASRKVGELAARCQELEQGLAAAEARRAARDGEVAQALAELEALRQQSAEHGVEAQQACELGRKVVELEQALAVARGEGARAERQRAAVVQELEGVRQQQAQAVAGAEQAQQALQAAEQRWKEERAQREAEQAAQQREVAAQRAALAEVQAALEQQRVERVQVERQGQDVAQRLAEAHRRCEELGAQLRQREAAADATASERQQLEEALRAAEATAEGLISERNEQRRAAAAATDQLEKERLRRVEEVMALQKELSRLEDQTRAGRPREVQAQLPEEPEAADYDAPLIIERSAPLDAALDAGSETIETPAPEVAPAASPASAGWIGEIVLIDVGARGDEASAALQGAGFEVTRAAPSDQTVDELARRKINCVMLNLAAGPAAWRTLRLLRERTGTRNLPILAYLMPPDASKGFCFGRADFGVWPMDPERMLERIGRLRAKAKRVLAVSADVDGINRLREPLANAGVSTSVVLDGKQVLDFAAMVQPEAVIVHLSPDCPAIGRALAGLRAEEVTRTIPLLVLLDKAPAREEAFYAATARELSLKSNFVFSSLPSEIARLMA
jgi:chromosome segregation ATPase